VDGRGFLDETSTRQIGPVLYEGRKRTCDPAFLSQPLRRPCAEMDDESLDPGSRRGVPDLLAQDERKTLTTLTPSDVDTPIHWVTGVRGPRISWTAKTPLAQVAQLTRFYRAEWQATGNAASLETAI
jgi:hypothetical protein